jgi:hypothetical protein
MEPWKLVFDEDAFHFIVSRRSDDRRRLLSALEELRNDPSRKPHYFTKDPTGRDLSVWGRKPFLVTYWLDPWVKELRVINIEKIRY